MSSLPCPSTRAVGRAAALPSSLQTRINKTTNDGRRRYRRSLSSPSTLSAALPAFLADLPPPALAAAAATAAAAAASAAARFALLSAVDYAVATRLSAAVAPLRDASDPSSDRKRALLLPSAGKDGKGDGSRQGSRDLFLLPDRVGECVAVAQGIDEGWWGRAGVQSGVSVSCRSRDPGDLGFLNNRGGSASSTSSSSSSSSSMFDLVLSRGGLSNAAAAAAAASSGSNNSGLSDLLVGAARVLKPGSGILVAAERLQGGGGEGEGGGAGATLFRGLTGLGGGASSALSLAELEKALEAALGFSKVALDVVCSGTDPHAVVVAFRDETSVFGVGGGRSAALSAGTEEEDALAAALRANKRGKGKKGFK